MKNKEIQELEKRSQEMHECYNIALEEIIRLKDLLIQKDKSYQEKIKKLKEEIGKNALKRNWDYTKAIDKIMEGE